MLKGIIFDLDDTLYSFKDAEAITMPMLIDYGAKLLHISQENFIEAFEWGKNRTKDLIKDMAPTHERVFFFQYALEYLNLNPYDKLLDLNDFYWQHFYLNMKPFPDALEVLRKLKEKRIATCLCTDMTAMEQYRKVRVLGMDTLLDKMVSSEEVCIEKPDRRTFLRALSKMGIAAEESLMVGDNLQKDILGAKNVGIRPLWRSANKITAEKFSVECFMRYDEDIWLDLLK